MYFIQNNVKGLDYIWLQSVTSEHRAVPDTRISDNTFRRLAFHLARQQWGDVGVDWGRGHGATTPSHLGL
jgi:hypothetical protein